MNSPKPYFKLSSNSEFTASPQIYSVETSNSISRTSLIKDGLNQTFTIPFAIESGINEIELVKKEIGNDGFEFSLLSHLETGYELNETYPFVIEKLEIRKKNESNRYILTVSDSKQQHLVMDVKRIEFLNLKQGDCINCKVKKIYPRKVFLALVPNKRNVFFNDLEYCFTIKDGFPSKNREDLAIFTVQHTNTIFELTIPKWQYHYRDKFEKIYGTVNKEGKISQIFSKIQHPLFDKGKVYNFLFIKEIDTSPNFIAVKGPDGCIYSIRKPFIYLHKEIGFNQNIKLVYRGLNEESGSLITKFFVSFEEIIHDFRALKRITFDAFKREIIDEIESTDDSFIINKLYRDYDNHENLWIISFCEVLRDKINQALYERDFEASLIFIDVLVKFEEWILTSGFLSSFSSETAEKTTKVASLEIDTFRKEAKALELLLDNNEKEYVSEFINDLKIKKLNEETTYKCYVTFYLFKHQFIETPILNDNEYLELIFLVGNNNFFSQELGLFHLVNGELERIKQFFERKLFHHVFINSEKRRAYYANNVELLKYIKYTYFSLAILIEFNATQIAFYTSIRLLKLKGLYNDEEVIQKKIFSKGLRLILMTPMEIFDQITKITTWTLDELKILQWDIDVSHGKQFKNLHTLQNSLNDLKYIEARVVGNSYLGYELMHKEDSLILPFFNAYKKFRRGEVISCSIYQIDLEFNQALVKTSIDRSQVPFDQKIEEGAIVKGVVKAIENFGAFIFLGKVDGLIPKREVSKNFLRNIEDILEIGDIVEVKIMKIEKEGDIVRISLSRKEAIIASQNVEKLNYGNYNAVITSVDEEFGIFIELENGLSGLVRREEISWNDYQYLSNLYSPGENISVKYLKSNGVKNYFSLKRTIADPFFNKFNNQKFYNAKLTGLLTFDKWLEHFQGDFKPISDSEKQMCYCPFCYEKSLYHGYNTKKLTGVRTLIKKNEERFWSCMNCRHYQQEVIQFFIPEIHCQAEWPLQGLTNREYHKIIRSLNKNDELQLKIKRADYSKKKLFIDVNFKSLRKAALYTEVGLFEKNVSQEIAGCYEAYGFLENDLGKKWNYLQWAKYYYGASKSAKSYYLNVYINYIKILNSIIIDGNLNNIENYLEKVKILISDIEIESGSIENFPVIEKIITLLKVLSQFGSKSDDAYKYLLNVSLGESSGHDYVKDLASSILSYNLQGVDANIVVVESLRTRILSVLKSSLTSFENFEIDNVELKKRVLVEKLIEKRERIDVEFKSSLQVPVMSKDVKRMVREIEFEFQKELDGEVKNTLLQRLIQLKQINPNDKLLIEKVNHSIMKTIAGFANTLGGYLLIGVDEDADGNPEIGGLNPDYTKFKNQDGILLRLDELIQKYFGNSFNNVLLASVDFVLLKGKEILLLNINKSEKPIFVNHNNEKRFYIRRQASTVELTAYELYEYISSKNKGDI